MNTSRVVALAAVLTAVGGISACRGSPQTESSGTEVGGEVAAVEAVEATEGREHVEGGEHREGGEDAATGEHEGEGAEHEGRRHDEGGEGEESGTYIARGARWDAVRRGARLVLGYDATADAFRGTVLNTTEGDLCGVRVEVHLAEGTELGPTERVDLVAGQSIEVTLPVGGIEFESWTAHPEVSACSGG
jgi:hypothetical protein